MLRWLKLSFAIFLACLRGSVAFSQNGALAVSDDILVRAPAGDQKLIDRDVYVVKDNAQAQTESGLQLMRKVPSVTVSSDDKIQLLGDPNVKVMIDGHAAVDGSRALKALPAAQIARIEVMTNPSAAYSAEGTSGVINIITRHRTTPGLGGATTITRSGFGGVITKIAPSLTAGPWSTALSLTLDNSRFRNDVTQDRTATDPIQDFAMLRHNIARDNDFSAHAEITYSTRPSHSWTLTIDHQDSKTTNFSAQSAISRGSSLYPISRNTQSHWGYYNDNASLAYTWTGKRHGESLSLSAAFTKSRQPTDDHVEEIFDDTSQDSLFQHDDGARSAELKLDYAHPFRKSDVVTIGASISHDHKTQLDGLAISGNHIGSLPFGPTEISGNWTTVAAYGTLQFPLDKWTILPGLRLESRNADSAALGPGGRGSDFLIFPSVHAERSLTKRLNLSLSFSRRVEWPSLRQLDPIVHYYDPLNGVTGNPTLKPQLTNAVEVSFAYNLARQSVTIKMYDRETAAAWLNNATLLPNGVSLTSVSNIGSLQRLGGELVLQGPIVKRLHYNANIDLLVRRSKLYENGVVAADSLFTYSGNAQIEYRDKTDGKAGANHINLEVQYVGPSHSFQVRSSSYTLGSLTWTHDLTPRVSSVLKINDFLMSDGSSIDVVGANYRQSTHRLDDKLRITASVICRLGKVK